MIWVPILNRAASAGAAPVWDAGESVALNVIESEYCGEAGEKPKVGAAAALFTVCVNVGDVLLAKLLLGSKESRSDRASSSIYSRGSQRGTAVSHLNWGS